MSSPRAGQAQTVLGAIAADQMGITLPHEHLLIDFEVMFREPPSASERGLAHQPVSMENLGWVRQNFSSNLDNLRLLDEDVARDEALLFKNAGGRTLVDPTNRGLEIVEMIRKEGGDLGRTIMCHIERTIADRMVLLELAATGVYLEYDLFGLETSYYPYNPAFDMPNDGERMRQILFLIERGHLAQLLLSHDIAYKHCLTKWGGFGYHHLLVNVIPRLRAKGADDKTIQTLLVDNPRRVFVFA